MSDPTQPTRDDDETFVGAIADALPGDRDDEPLDGDLDDDALDSADADERAAREGTKRLTEGDV